MHDICRVSLFRQRQTLVLPSPPPHHLLPYVAGTSDSVEIEDPCFCTTFPRVSTGHRMEKALVVMGQCSVATRHIWFGRIEQGGRRTLGIPLRILTTAHEVNVWYLFITSSSGNLTLSVNCLGYWHGRVEAGWCGYNYGVASLPVARSGIK